MARVSIKRKTAKHGSTFNSRAEAGRPSLKVNSKPNGTTKKAGTNPGPRGSAESNKSTANKSTASRSAASKSLVAVGSVAALSAKPGSKRASRVAAGQKAKSASQRVKLADAAAGMMKKSAPSARVKLALGKVAKASANAFGLKKGMQGKRVDLPMKRQRRAGSPVAVPMEPVPMAGSGEPVVSGQIK